MVESKSCYGGLGGGRYSGVLEDVSCVVSRVAWGLVSGARMCPGAVVAFVIRQVAAKRTASSCVYPVHRDGAERIRFMAYPISKVAGYGFSAPGCECPYADGCAIVPGGDRLENDKAMTGY